MPYNPGVTNRGGEFIMRGVEVGAQGISEGIKAIGERNKEHDYLDGVGAYYFKGDPEKYEKFRAGSLGAKRGMVTGAQAEQASVMRDRTFNAQQGWQGDESLRGWTQVIANAHTDKLRADPRQSQPQDAEGMPGYKVIPRTGQVIAPAKPAPPRADPAQPPIVSPDSKFYYHEPTGSWKPMPGGGMTELMTMLAGGKAPDPATPRAGVIASTTASPAGGSAPKVSTKAERDALPAGTIYIGPDGKRYRKQ